MRSLPLLALLLAGCAGTASHVLVGDPRAPVDPAEVQIYLQPPSRYDEIAIVTADNRGSWQWSAQGASDAALERLKIEAASLGANGITGLMIGSGWSGSTAALGLGTGFGSYGWGSGWSGPGYGLGAAVGVPAPARSISALAIRVIAP
jgi:hypothetical protein